jgi:hypothetical protein
MTRSAGTQEIAAPTESSVARYEPVVLNDALAAVTELNLQLLDALARNAQAQGPFPLGELLRAPIACLSSSQRRQAAQCGVLLADVGFADLDRWRQIALQSECNLLTEPSDWLSSEESVVLAYAVFMVAWHVVHVSPSAAGFLLGMTEPVVAVYRKLGVADLAHVARSRPQWVRPRWYDRPDVWTSVVEGAMNPASHDPASIVLRCLSADGSSRLHAAAEASS